ncbi:MAG: flagellin [Myxococcota bacterium]
MRITQAMISRNGTDAISAQRNRLAETQEQAATGLQLNRPSDDPVDYRKTLGLKNSLSQTERYLRGIQLAAPRLGTTENALADSAGLVLDAKVLSQSNTASQESRDILKGQVADIFDQVFDLANKRSPEGSYVFGGTAGDAPPFEQTGTFVSGSPTPVVTFVGDPSAISIDIDTGVSVEVTRNGEQAFQGPMDIFGVLGDLWTALDTGDITAMQTAQGDLEDMRAHLVLERSALGSQQRKAESFESRLEDQVVKLDTAISFIEDADSVEVYSDLVERETALQASLAVTARLISPSLLDFI